MSVYESTHDNDNCEILACLHTWFVVIGKESIRNRKKKINCVLLWKLLDDISLWRVKGDSLGLWKVSPEQNVLKLN